MAGTARRAVPASVQIAPLTANHPRSQCALKNLAGFDRGFRFTYQKHICAALKDERRADSKTENPTIKKENVYEKSKDYVHIGSARACLLCRIADGIGKAAANAHPNTDCHAATR